MNDRRSIDPILKKIRAEQKAHGVEQVRQGKKIDGMDKTIRGNGSMGLRTRTMINWYGFIGLSAVITILTGCAVFLR